MKDLINEMTHYLHFTYFLPNIDIAYTFVRFSHKRKRIIAGACKTLSISILRTKHSELTNSKSFNLELK